MFEMKIWSNNPSGGGGGGGGGWEKKNWVGFCGPLPKTLTLFMTTTCEIPYLIYDLTLKSNPVSELRYN